jgi:heptosyltransferase-2
MLVSKNIKNILVIRPDAIGDLVLTLPAIHALKKSFPEAEITALIREYTAPILKGNPDVSYIIYDYDLKKYNFDLSVNFYNQFPDTFAAFKAGIPYRLGDSSRILIAWMNNLRVFRHWEDDRRHEIDFNFDLLAPLGIKDTPEKPKLFIDMSALSGINTLLAQYGVKQDDRLAGIHLGSATSRAWDIESFARTARWLADKLNYKIILLGGEPEMGKTASFPSSSINFVGKLSLTDLIALISRLNFYLGMDTGPSHLAAALGIPMVMLFLNRQAQPTRWGPYYVRHLTVALKKGENNIPAEKVIAACEKVAAGGGATTPAEAFPLWREQSLG